VLTRAPSNTPIENTTEPVIYERIISGGACGLVVTANAVIFLTIFGFFLAFDNDDFQYSVWIAGRKVPKQWWSLNVPCTIEQKQIPNIQQKQNWLFIPTSQFFWWEDWLVRILLEGKISLSCSIVWSWSILFDSNFFQFFCRINRYTWFEIYLCNTRFIDQ